MFVLTLRSGKIEREGVKSSSSTSTSTSDYLFFSLVASHAYFYVFFFFTPSQTRFCMFFFMYFRPIKRTTINRRLSPTINVILHLK